jgi:hypothetical protein
MSCGVAPEADTMKLLEVLGQYLLLSFVLPGFCYVAAAALLLPEKFRTHLKTYWWAAAIVGGLLISSVAFAIEITIRYLCVKIDCDWFPRIPFEQIHDMGSVVNFFAGETFMHLNIGLGFFIILVIFLITTAYHGWKDKYGVYRLKAPWVTVALAALVAANLTVSSYLFHRVNDIAFNLRDEVDRPSGEGTAKYCICMRGPDIAECDKLKAAPARFLTY